MSLIQRASNADLMKQEAADLAAKLTPIPVVDGLAAHVRKAWQAAHDHRQTSGVQARLEDALRAKQGKYHPDKLRAIEEFGGSDVYARVAAQKMRTATGWLRDVYAASPQDRPWSLNSTPRPELPPDAEARAVQTVMKQVEMAQQSGMPIDAGSFTDMVTRAVAREARKDLAAVEDVFDDQLTEGGWYKAFNEFLSDITTYPAGFIKGPVVRKRPQLTWGTDAEGATVPVVKDITHVEFDRVSPFDIYPAPHSTDTNDGPIIQKHRMSRSDLSALKGLEAQGYNDVNISAVLEQYGRGGLRDWTTTGDTTREALENRADGMMTGTDDSPIDAIEYWGSVSGRMLLDWGVDAAKVPDPDQEYNANVWLIGSYVIKAVLNADPLGRTPYSKASYEEVPGSFWGNGVYDLMADQGDVANAALRSLVNNMGFASGPMVGINIDRLQPGEELTQLRPLQVIQLRDAQLGGGQAPALEFYQPNANVNELLAVYEKAVQISDDVTGIPRYMAGSEKVGGAGRTASGLSMLMNAASKSLKAVVDNVDSNVIVPVLERLHYWNMRYNDDPSVKRGDVKVVARGSSALAVKEAQQIRRNEFLQVVMNPALAQFVPPGLLKELVKQTAKDIGYSVEDYQFDAPPQAPQVQGQQGAQPAPQMRASQEQLQDGTPTTDAFSPIA